MKLLSRMNRRMSQEMSYLLGQVQIGNTMAICITATMVTALIVLGFWISAFLGIDLKDPAIVDYEESKIAGCRTLPEGLQEDCLWNLKAEGIDID